MHRFAILLTLVACGPDSVSDSTDMEDASIERCLHHHGIGTNNSWWNYENTYSTQTGSRGITVHAFDEDNQTATLLVKTMWNSDNGETPQVRLDSYEDVSCDADGLYLHKAFVDNWLTEDAYGYTVVYTTPLLLRPHTMQVGDTWTSTQEGTVSYEEPDVPDATLAETFSYEVTDEVSFTLGTETVTAYEVSKNGGRDYLWVQGIGVVKQNQWSLVEYAEGD